MAELELNAKETALVLIDLEKGIVAMSPQPHSAADVVSRCAKLAEAVRASGGLVVYVHVLMHEVVRLESDAPMSRPGGPPPPEMSDLVPEAGYQPAMDVLVAKRGWDAFTATNLDQALRRKGIKTIILGGIATNIGVESTARSAQGLGYNTVFAEDAMSSRSAEMHDFATKNIFPIIGRVRSAKEIEAALKA